MQPVNRRMLRQRSIAACFIASPGPAHLLNIIIKFIMTSPQAPFIANKKPLTWKTVLLYFDYKTPVAALQVKN
jgi:hypothetical protein